MIVRVLLISGAFLVFVEKSGLPSEMLATVSTKIVEQ